MAPAKKDTAAQRTSNVYLEHEGERLIQRIIETVENVPWSITLLQLAWTAGPVTFIAAQGGYWLGYKEFLPADRIMFFIGYTIIAGIIALFTKVVYDGYAMRKHERREQAMTTAVDRLPELIFAVRDLTLANLPPEQRKREAAWRLMKEAELGPVGLSTAVEDMTGSTHLADTARRVEIYRRQGMYHRANDLLQDEADLIQLALDELNSSAPAMATTLRDRLEGRGVTVKQGVPRDENFIERIFAAIGEDSPALMTLYDAEEILVLAFELLSGREIPMLIFKYRGSWRLARATDTLEKARVDYSIAQAMGYSRLKALVAFLTESDTELAEATAGQPSAVLLEKVQQTLDQLRDEVYDLRVEVANGRLTAVDELEEKTRILATALKLYETLRPAYRELARRHAALIRARRRWEELSSKTVFSSAELRLGRRRSGLAIAERNIRLNNEEKLEAAEALRQPLSSLDLRRNRRRTVFSQPTPFRPITAESAKDIAVEVALILEQHIQISRPAVQRAINASNAILLANIEPGMSAATKAAVGAAVAKEVRTDIGRAAEWLAAALVRHYNVELTERTIAFLHDSYGANLDTLRVLATYSEPATTIPVAQLRAKPPTIPPSDPNWERQVNRSRRLLDSHGRRLGI